MQREVFSAGTAPGSPNTQNEIKTLLCYLLSQTGEPLTFQQIHTALRKDDLVNYFELTQAMESLVESGHFMKIDNIEEKIAYYSVTELGLDTAKTLDTSLPFTVREKAVDAAELTVARHKRMKEVATSIKEIPQGGFHLELSIPEGKTNLISLTLYAPTLVEAEKLERGFLNDPIFLYQSVMSLLAGDLRVLGELRPTKRKLF